MLKAEEIHPGNTDISSLYLVLVSYPYLLAFASCLCFLPVLLDLKKALKSARLK